MSQKDGYQPNPKRVAAGRTNREKRGPLTEAGRQRLREAAFQTKPWLQSTGPRTTEGRAQSRLNGKKRQSEVLSVREAKAELALVSNLIRGMCEFCAGTVK